MVLLAKAKEAIKNNYFSLWDIVSLLAKNNDSNFQEVGEFLGHTNISVELSIYKRDQFSRLYQIDTEWMSNPVDEIITILNNIFPFDSEEEQKAERSKAWGKSLGLYWLKEDIYNFKPIMDLGIIEKPPTQVIDLSSTIQPPYVKEIDPDKYKFFLYKKPLLTFDDCACIIAGYDPLDIQKLPLEDIDEIIPEYSRACGLINSAIEAGVLNCFNYKVSTGNLKEYLAKEDIEIKGFNDNEYAQFQISIKEQNKFNNINIATVESDEIKLLKNTIDELRAVLESKDNDLTALAIDLIVTEGAYDKLKDSELSKKDLNSDADNSTIEQLKKGNNQLKARIGELEQENKRLKIELSEKVSLDSAIVSNQDQAAEETKENYSDLTPEQEIPNARQRNNVLRIISILSDMAGLPPEHFVAFNMMEAHATKKCKEIPKKDTIANWLKESKKF